MNRWCNLGLGVAGIFFVLAQAPLWPQGGNEKKPAAIAGIEGTWILVAQEHGGELMSMLADRFPRPNEAEEGPIVWKITKNKIETNVAAPMRARHVSDLEIDPAGKVGWLNLFSLDQDGKRTQKFNSYGIYHVKDDYLMICTAAGERPVAFSTSAKDKQYVLLHVFRRSPAKVIVNGAMKSF